MVEKFDDYEGGQFLSKSGRFTFKIISAELKDSSKGDPMWVFECKCKEGTTKIYHSLNPKARWTFNKLIKACMGENTPAELDYFSYGQTLVGKTFIADVIEDSYEKEVKKPNDDGTFTSSTEIKTSYKIDTTSYEVCDSNPF